MVAAKSMKPDVDAPPAPATYKQVDTDKLTPDPGQPRKTFDEAALAELADSVKIHGVIVPLEVRVHPAKGDGWYMIVAGERRWRAAKIAKLAQVPVLVVELTPAQVLEHQLIENSLREDVPPLEEAEAYKALLKNHGYSMELLVEKTKRSKAHLYGRLKLLQLVPFAKKALTDGKLTVAIAELIARVDPKLQEQCTKEVLGKLVDDVAELGIEHERVAEEGKGHYGGDPLPLSYDATRALIRRKYATKLSLAKFNPADPTLTKAGACTTCEFRSGNQPELPGLNGKADDLCTKPACFEEKSLAAWKVAAAEAETRGLEVVEGKDARGCFDFDGVKVRSGGPYVDLTTELPYDLQKTPGKPKTFGELLGKHAGEIPRALVQDESGAPRELLDKKKAIEKLVELGKVDKPKKTTTTSSSSSSGGLTYAEMQARDKKKKELNDAALARSFEQIAAKATEDPGKKEMALWRWIAHALLDDLYGFDLAAEHFGVQKNAKGIAGVIDKAKSLDDLRGTLLILLGSDAGVSASRVYSDKEDRDRFDALCSLLGVDHDKSLVQAKEASKAEAKADAAKDAKKAPAKAKKGKGK